MRIVCGGDDRAADFGEELRFGSGAAKRNESDWQLCGKCKLVRWASVVVSVQANTGAASSATRGNNTITSRRGFAAIVKKHRMP
mmetsp:Transcript_25738/g.39904  ORF Transcript_25738/g.39904 Transcript_25738/m.39904 type:complete len:84 (+) Transcript_25738:870-1121(+)